MITVVALFFQAAYCGVNMWREYNLSNPIPLLFLLTRVQVCLNGVGTQLWNVPATAVMPLINVIAPFTESISKLTICIASQSNGSLD